MHVPERLVFQSTIESTLDLLGPRLDAGCAARLREAGVDVSTPLLDAYPVEVYAAVLRVVAAVLHPGDPQGEGMREIGRGFVRQFGATRVGKAALTLAKLMGPDYFVRHFGRAIRFGDNYTSSRVERLGERHYRVSVYPAQLHPFYLGLLDEGLAVVGARRVHAELHTYYREGFTFDVRWE